VPIVGATKLQHLEEALRVFSEHYAMLATAGLVLRHFIVRTNGRGDNASDPMYRSDSVLAELSVSPVTVFRLAWLVSSALSSAMTLANFCALQSVLGLLRAAPSCPPAILALSAFTSPAVSLFAALQGSFQHYLANRFSLSVLRLLGGGRVKISHTLVSRAAFRVAVLLSFLHYSAIPVYYTLASMPWWAKPLALANPQTFLIEAGRGGLSPEEAAVAIVFSLLVYYTIGEKLFESFIEARRRGQWL